MGTLWTSARHTRAWPLAFRWLLYHPALPAGAAQNGNCALQETYRRKKGKRSVAYRSQPDRTLTRSKYAAYWLVRAATRTIARDPQLPPWASAVATLGASQLDQLGRRDPADPHCCARWYWRPWVCSSQNSRSHRGCCCSKQAPRRSTAAGRTRNPCLCRVRHRHGRAAGYH